MKDTNGWAKLFIPIVASSLVLATAAALASPQQKQPKTDHGAAQNGNEKRVERKPSTSKLIDINSAARRNSKSCLGSAR